MRKIIYIDLDNTLADYVGMAKEMEITLEDAKHTEGFFRRLKPMPYATTSPRLEENKGVNSQATRLRL